MINNSILLSYKRIHFWIFLILMGVFAHLLYKHLNMLKMHTSQINLTFTSIALLMHLNYLILSGFGFSILCAAKRCVTLKKEWIGLSFIASFANQLLPYRPGLIIRYLYLKENYNLNIKDFLSINFWFFLNMLFVGAIFCFFGFFIFSPPIDLITKEKSINVLDQWLLIILTIIILIVLFKISVPKIYTRLKTDLIRNLTEFSYTSIFKAFLTCIAKHLALALIFYFCFAAFGLEMSPWTAIGIAGIISVALIIPITPGNIGLIEYLMGFMTQWWYHDFSLGLVCTLLYRVILFLGSGTGCIIFLALLADKIPSISLIKIGTSKSVD